MPPQQKALLDTIAASEGTSSSPITKNNGYDVIVTGIDLNTGKLTPEIFTDYLTHPFATGRAPKTINRRGLLSTASGRYQQLRGNYFSYSKLLGLKDFSPSSQDAIALQQIKETGAFPLLESGDFDGVVNKIKHLWASFTGAGYGQNERSIEWLRDKFVKAGGVIK